MKMLISIVNWNSSTSTNECLAGIAALSKDTQPDVVVTDNHSTEEQLEISPDVKQKLKSLKVIKNSKNLGFAGGHNPIIKQAKTDGYDYIFLLNPDTQIIDKDLFSELAGALESNPKALGANPTILSGIDPDVIWYGGGRLSLLTGAASHSAVGKAEPTANKTTTVNLLTGGCLAIALKRAGLPQLLLFEDYFLYWEDTDWSARAVKSGFELLYVPPARLLHHVSNSLGVRSPAYIYYNIRNHFVFVRRQLNPVCRPLGWLAITWITLKYKLNILLRYDNNRIRALKAVWWAWADGILGRSGERRRSL